MPAPPPTNGEADFREGTPPRQLYPRGTSRCCEGRGDTSRLRPALGQPGSYVLSAERCAELCFFLKRNGRFYGAYQSHPLVAPDIWQNTGRCTPGDPGVPGGRALEGAAKAESFSDAAWCPGVSPTGSRMPAPRLASDEATQCCGHTVRMGLKGPVFKS